MKLHLPLTVFLAMAGGALAQSVPTDETGVEGRQVAQTIFATMDQSGRGYVTMGDIEWFRDSAFAGMDYESDGRVTYAEFASWDPGFGRVAEGLGRAEAYVTASKIVFAYWDRDGDGILTAREFRIAMSHDFRRADLDDDALLTRDEFISGFPIIVAMRAAIRPDL